MTDDERFRNAVIYGTSHPEMYMTTDDALIEVVARAMFKDDQMCRLDIAKAALAVARPIIEAQERERCARIAEEFVKMPNGFFRAKSQKEIAAEIRAAALKETGDE